MIYEMDEPAYRALVAERAKRTAWFEPLVRWFEPVQWVDAEPGRPGAAPRFRLTPLSWLLALGLAGALVPGRFVRTSILWLPLLLYVGIVFAVGDRVSRYFQPVEWAMFTLIAVGLDVVLDALAGLWKSVRPPVAEPAPATAG